MKTLYVNSHAKDANEIKLDCNAKLLNELKVGFEEDKLIPLAADQSMRYSPEQASEAYQKVIQGFSEKRIVIKFSK